MLIYANITKNNWVKKKTGRQGTKGNYTQLNAEFQIIAFLNKGDIRRPS